ncbi:hypothetical protein JCM8097_004122 [Rhodosporidiobolus ruineniae]
MLAVPTLLTLALAFSFSIASASPHRFEKLRVVKRVDSSAGCSTLQMVVARASTEMAGEGMLSAVTSRVKEQVSGSDSQAIDYPATLQNYLSSESQGVEAMVSDVNDFASKCPTTPIVLMGYSQGAHVVGDTVSGGKLSDTASGNIIALIQMGDPTFVPGKDYDVGTSTTRGLFARSDTSALDAIADKVQSYCDSGDQFCDDAASFIVEKYQAASTAKRARSRPAMLVSPKLLAAVLASASLLLETASAAAIPKERNFERATACSTLQIIVARGSTEAAGE